ncbi:hypothetical protein SAMN02746041_01128 [Desulfacinum hydrothermale DSM 13146]|uniref:Uncharacterized protein n=1 Tax=Desulfacinum hydrothermale DSM 13146 TaxID=1121390 RepID=A0A1W1XBH2_9BACT|nr:hypothetical protein [Desulfacinum hydrothermale]SMC21124.1 hypothetical protein SAMN02746041_01128 [Desulfacinum hydrothermale DSM 13146]
MDYDKEEYERRKRAIFEQMSKRGQQRILRLGYEKWDPFQEPKDPREQIRSSSAIRAGMILAQFYEEQKEDERFRQHHKDLMDLCRGILRRDTRARAIVAFCRWYEEQEREVLGDR